MGLIIVLVLVGLGISYVFQKSLWKSHPKNDIIIENIFGIYLFGIAGYLIVIALPTKEECVHKKGFSVENNTIDKHKDKNDK